MSKSPTLEYDGLYSTPAWTGRMLAQAIFDELHRHPPRRVPGNDPADAAAKGSHDASIDPACRHDAAARRPGMGPGGHRRRMGPATTTRTSRIARRAQNSATTPAIPSTRPRGGKAEAGYPRSCRSPSSRPNPIRRSARCAGRSRTCASPESIDPIGGKVVAYVLAGYFGRADRTIWMDGRPRPSQYEHTWGGFSTGEWVAGGTQLKVTTTHMKTSFINRNGIPSSYRGVMTEFFSVRQHDGAPVDRGRSGVLEEPMVRSNNFSRALGQHVGPAIRSRPWMNWATARSAGCRTGRWARGTPSSPTGSGCRGRRRVAGRETLSRIRGDDRTPGRGTEAAPPRPGRQTPLPRGRR